MPNAIVALILFVIGILIGGFLGLVCFAVGIVFVALALRDLVG